jgi:hypothetical protein
MSSGLGGAYGIQFQPGSDLANDLSLLPNGNLNQQTSQSVFNNCDSTSSLIWGSDWTVIGFHNIAHRDIARGCPGYSCPPGVSISPDGRFTKLDGHYEGTFFGDYLIASRRSGVAVHVIDLQTVTCIDPTTPGCSTACQSPTAPCSNPAKGCYGPAVCGANCVNADQIHEEVRYAKAVSTGTTTSADGHIYQVDRAFIAADLNGADPTSGELGAETNAFMFSEKCGPGSAVASLPTFSPRYNYNITLVQLKGNTRFHVSSIPISTAKPLAAENPAYFKIAPLSHLVIGANFYIAPPPTAPPMPIRTWINVAANPVVRYTGSVHDWGGRGRRDRSGAARLSRSSRRVVRRSRSSLGLVSAARQACRARPGEAAASSSAAAVQPVARLILEAANCHLGARTLAWRLPVPACLQLPLTGAEG